MSAPGSVSVNLVQLSAGKFDTENGTNAASMTKTLSDIAAAKPKSLALHFHGGLVSRQSGMASAARLAPLYKTEGDAESFFVIWETSAGEIIGQNVKRIVNEPIFQSLLVRTTEFVKGKLEKTSVPGGRGIAGLPRTFASDIQDELDKGVLGGAMFGDLQTEGLTPAGTPEQALSAQEQEYIEEEVNRDPDLKRHVRNIVASAAEAGAKGVGVTTAESTLMDADVIAEISPPAEDEDARSILGTIMLGKRVITVVGAVIWRYANGRDHGLYLTIVEELMRAFYIRAAGRFLWTQMKEAVGSAFTKGPDYGGTALVEQLSALWKDAKPCVTLVGHSAGAIFVARLLKELDAAMDPAFRANVVLIAPACTFDYLADSLASAGKRVASLRIFGMSDAVERQDHLVQGVYPASLLYFVSGVLEDDRDEPLVGMERYYSPRYDPARFKTIADVKQFPCLQKDHAYAWSQTAGFDGANCDMTTHGGWVDAAATRESVLYLLRGGCAHDA